MTGTKSTKTTVQKALDAFVAQREHLMKVWGTANVTEYYDPGFVEAKRRMKYLWAAYTVESECLRAGV